MALEEMGYLVKEACDGHDASLFLGEISPNLIITDLLMPGKDGVELIREVRHDHKGIPIIAISGGAKLVPDTYLKLAHTLGADHILAKPFTPQELLYVVDQALGK
jgi:two-component system, cell cycle response regulator CpdR